MGLALCCPASPAGLRQWPARLGEGFRVKSSPVLRSSSMYVQERPKRGSRDSCSSSKPCGKKEENDTIAWMRDDPDGCGGGERESWEFPTRQSERRDRALPRLSRLRPAPQPGRLAAFAATQERVMRVASMQHVVALLCYVQVPTYNLVVCSVMCYVMLDGSPARGWSRICQVPSTLSETTITARKTTRESPDGSPYLDFWMLFMQHRAQ